MHIAHIQFTQLLHIGEEVRILGIRNRPTIRLPCNSYSRIV